MHVIEEWAAAELKGDTATLGALLTEDFVGIGPVGFMLTKQQWLDRYDSGNLVHTEFDLTEVAIRRYGTTAVVTGLQVQRSSHQGRQINGRFRATQVYVDDNGWRLASLHLCALPDTVIPAANR